jgi:uncharacterized protein (TIGR01777 family)
MESALSANRVRWDGESLGDWADWIDGCDVVINLVGRSVNCRYNPSNREQIVQSRVKSTRGIAEAIKQAKVPPPLWLQMSTATIYAHRYDAANDEETGIIGGGEANVADTWRFSIDVATAWEREVDAAELPATRTVKMRSAMVMSPDQGGVFDTLLRLVRFGLGGTCGNGKQYVSWIADTDFVRAVQFLIEKEQLVGAVNLCSPNALPNSEFMRLLRKAWGAPLGLPANELMLEIGAVILRTETELILKSRRVYPGKLLAAGFQFEQPDWVSAAQSLCTRWRQSAI